MKKLFTLIAFLACTNLLLSQTITSFDAPSQIPCNNGQATLQVVTTYTGNSLTYNLKTWIPGLSSYQQSPGFPIQNQGSTLTIPNMPSGLYMVIISLAGIDLDSAIYNLINPPLISVYGSPLAMPPPTPTYANNGP